MAMTEQELLQEIKKLKIDLEKERREKELAIGVIHSMKLEQLEAGRLLFEADKKTLEAQILLNRIVR